MPLQIFYTASFCGIGTRGKEGFRRVGALNFEKIIIDIVIEWHIIANFVLITIKMP